MEERTYKPKAICPLNFSLSSKLEWEDPGGGGQGVLTHPGKSQEAIHVDFLRNSGKDHHGWSQKMRRNVRT